MARTLLDQIRREFDRGNVAARRRNAATFGESGETDEANGIGGSVSRQPGVVES